MIIVEHNPALRRLIQRNIDQLVSADHVFITGNADAALAHLQQQPAGSLLIDAESPSATDYDLVNLASRIAPATKIILISQGGKTPLGAKICRLPISSCVDKSTFFTRLLELDSRRQSARDA